MPLKLKTLLLTLRMLSLASSTLASDWWLSTEMLYGKPFRSAGYSGQKAEGVGTQSRLEYRLQPWVAIGMGYAEAKIVQQLESADFGFMDGSLRLLYPGEFGIEPYMLLGFGKAGTDNASSKGVQRDAAGSGQASLGIMLASADRPWAIDGGVGYHRSGSDDNGFNMLEGHVGLQIRYGGSKPVPAEKDSYKDGLGMLKKKDYGKAAEAFSAAVKADPKSSRAWHGLGNAIYMQSLAQKKSALKDWGRSLALNPKNTELAGFVRDLKAMTADKSDPDEMIRVLKLYRLSMLPQR